MSVITEQTCEALWQRVATGLPTRTTDRDRTGDGNYARGHRNDIDIWVLTLGNVTLRATRFDWQTFNLAKDAEGVRRTLEVTRGEELLFRAEQEGAQRIVRFTGADERYVGTDTTQAAPWRITHGALTFVREIILE